MATTYTKLPLDHERIKDALTTMGATEIEKTTVRETQLQWKGMYKENSFLVNVYLLKDGLCTLGYATGFHRETFDELATGIAASCSYAQAIQLNVSIPKFDAANLALLREFLESRGAKTQEYEKQIAYELWRMRGPRGDVLTLKNYSNGTLTLQGRHVQVAAWADDFLRNVLSLDQLLEQQRKTFDIPLSIDDIKSELVGRLPALHDYLSDAVRKQFSSALALSKVRIPLEDYSVLAFPALRGLEGLCMQLLVQECGYAPPKAGKLGEYFEKSGANFIMRAVPATGVAPKLQILLSRSYTMWHQQRHALFHMDGTVETSRVIENREEAVALVDEVLNLVDGEFARFKS